MARSRSGVSFRSAPVCSSDFFLLPLTIYLDLPNKPPLSPFPSHNQNFGKLAVWPRGAWRLDQSDGDSGNHLHLLSAQSALRTGGQMGVKRVGRVHHARQHQISTLQLDNLPHAHPVSSFLCQGIDCPSPPAQKRSTCDDLTVCSIIFLCPPPILFLGGPH